LKRAALIYAAKNGSLFPSSGSGPAGDLIQRASAAFAPARDFVDPAYLVAGTGEIFHRQLSSIDPSKSASTAFHGKAVMP
jgi:hypothetical protein